MKLFPEVPISQLTGADVKRARLLLGWTQAQLAEAAGYSSAGNIGSYERGDLQMPAATRMRLVCAMLDEETCR